MQPRRWRPCPTSYRLGGTHAALDRDHISIRRCRVWLDTDNNLIRRTAQRELPESADLIEGNEVRRGRLHVGGGVRSDVLQLQRRIEILSRSGVPQRYVRRRSGDVRRGAEKFDVLPMMGARMMRFGLVCLLLAIGGCARVHVRTETLAAMAADAAAEVASSEAQPHTTAAHR